MILFLFLAFSIANKSDIVYLENICLYTITFGIVWAKITIKLIVILITYSFNFNLKEKLNILNK